MPDTAAAIRALTHQDFEQHERGVTRCGSDVPVLDRSIANDLRDIERMLGSRAKGLTSLSVIAASIDEALLALLEDSNAR